MDTRPLSEHDREVGSRVGRGKGKNPGNFLHERGSICPEKIKKACLHPAEGGDTLYDKYRVLITISTECWKGISNANYELRTKTKTKTKNSFTLIYTREIIRKHGKIGSRIEFNATSSAIEFSNSHPFNTDIYSIARKRKFSNSLILEIESPNRINEDEYPCSRRLPERNSKRIRGRRRKKND